MLWIVVVGFDVVGWFKCVAVGLGDHFENGHEFDDDILRVTFGNGIVRDVAAVSRDAAAHEPVYILDAQQSQNEISEKIVKMTYPNLLLTMLLLLMV